MDKAGQIVLYANESGRANRNLRNAPGIGSIIDQVLLKKKGSYQYSSDGQNHLLNVRFIPELNWYLFVEKVEDEALAAIRQALYVNLAIGFAILMLVLSLAHYALNHYQQRIEQMAITDKLTGLLNRHACGILLHKMFSEYGRNQRTFSALLLDIDHFKGVNDRYNHRVGDEILSRVAQILQSGLRQSDMAVRWGGEEFLLILKDCPLEEAKRIAEKLRFMVEMDAIDVSGNKVGVTLSIGVAEYNGKETQDEWIGRADDALYSAKASGRNNVHAGNHSVSDC